MEFDKEFSKKKNAAFLSETNIFGLISLLWDDYQSIEEFKNINIIIKYLYFTCHIMTSNVTGKVAMWTDIYWNYFKVKKLVGIRNNRVSLNDFLLESIVKCMLK